jgi:hypothetical protein
MRIEWPFSFFATQAVAPPVPSFIWMSYRNVDGSADAGVIGKAAPDWQAVRMRARMSARMDGSLVGRPCLPAPR